MSGKTNTDRTNGFKDGRDYMRVKKNKLTAQNDKIRESLRTRNKALRTDIFKGVSINVNGRTQPTADELKRIILLNGGEYHPYYRYQTTKFMIATNLSTARVKMLRPDDRIVKPEWITESVQAKCLLPYQDYQLFADEPRGEKGKVSALPKGASSSQSPGKKKLKQQQLQVIKHQQPPPPANPQLTSSSQQNGHSQNSSQPDQKTSQPNTNKPITMADFVIRGVKPQSRFPTPKIPERQPVANLCGKTQIDDVIALLNEWVGCPEGVLDEDTACVTKYFYDLMSEKNHHNKFYEIISAFQQRVVQHDDREWTTLYNNLVTTLKNELNQSMNASQNLYQLMTLIEIADKHIKYD